MGLLLMEPRAKAGRETWWGAAAVGWWERRSGEISYQRRGNYPVYCCRPLPIWGRGLQMVPASHHVLVLLLGLLNDLQGTEKVHSATVRSSPRPWAHHRQAM